MLSSIRRSLGGSDFKLAQISAQLRLDLLNLIYGNGGHIGGSLSSLDLIVSVYFSDIFNLKKDKFILSAGHYAPALYVVLAQAGYFPKKLLATYSQFKSPLQGHITTDVPGVNYSSGSLGQGLSFSSGLALGTPKSTIICLTSDGEHNEGQVWEAAMFASKYKLGNLINIVDHNKYQIDGSTDQIMPLGDLAAKYLRFGWTVTVVDGHNFGQITDALSKAKKSTHPTCIIANTVFAKGISFMQYDPHYHDIKGISPPHYLRAKKELEEKL